MVLIALAWIPVIKGAHGLYNYLQAVQGYLAPPIFVVFFFGVFWKRLNAQGCLWAMIVGFAMGLFRMLVDTPVTLGLAGFENGYTHGLVPLDLNNIYFQYFSVLITIVSAVVMVGVSLATAEPDYARIESLTFGTATEEDRRADARQLGLARRAGLGASCSAASSARTCTSAASEEPSARRGPPRRRRSSGRAGSSAKGDFSMRPPDSFRLPVPHS